jgi:hypothetical protein
MLHPQKILALERDVFAACGLQRKKGIRLLSAFQPESYENSSLPRIKERAMESGVAPDSRSGLNTAFPEKGGDRWTGECGGLYMDAELVV